jgi:uncharacterized glyoxalase superfamily protein PhnB
MRVNRSMPASEVIPVLGYRDVAEAVDWLCNAFGFTVRLRIGNHRVQLNVGRGAVVVAGLPAAAGAGSTPAAGGRAAHSIMVRIADVDGHHERSIRRGARVLEAPTNYPYGERQYTVEDPGGHRWTFSQTIADVAPAEWGGDLVSDPNA